MDKYLNWSIFDWLCLYYVLKERRKKAIIIIDVFMQTNSPEEAEAMFKDMVKDEKDREAVHNTDFFLDKETCDNLFRKGMLKRKLPALTGKKKDNKPKKEASL